VLDLAAVGIRCRDTTSGVGHSEKRRCEGGVIELSASVALDTLNGASKLHEHTCEEVRLWRRYQTYDTTKRSTSSE
jgi:hypothetical protein